MTRSRYSDSDDDVFDDEKLKMKKEFFEGKKEKRKQMEKSAALTYNYLYTELRTMVPDH
jgi:hypothetical protein